MVSDGGGVQGLVRVRSSVILEQSSVALGRSGESSRTADLPAVQRWVGVDDGGGHRDAVSWRYALPGSSRTVWGGAAVRCVEIPLSR